MKLSYEQNNRRNRSQMQRKPFRSDVLKQSQEVNSEIEKLNLSVSLSSDGDAEAQE